MKIKYVHVNDKISVYGMNFKPSHFPIPRGIK